MKTLHHLVGDFILKHNIRVHTLIRSKRDYRAKLTLDKSFVTLALIRSAKGVLEGEVFGNHA